MHARSAPPLSVAVVGAGLAGLVAAWRLAQQGHRVSVYERHAAPGFVAHSVGVPVGDGRPGEAPVQVDVPLRVFYAGYYPNLVALYDELGVASEAVSYASSFHGDDGALYFRYRNWLVAGASLSWVAPQDLLGKRARRIAAGAWRFRRQAPRALALGELSGRTLGELVAHGDNGGRFDEAFVHGLLLPAIATVATCSYEDALRYPAAVIVEYLARGLTRQPVRRVVHGAGEVARRLCEGIAERGGELHLGCPLVGLKREAAGHRDTPAPRPRVVLRTADGGVVRVDHVVLATQANQALALLDDASETERQVLGGFTYRPVEVVMHRDTGLLPARRRDWSAVNLLVAPAAAQPQSTIWINAVQPALGERASPIFQTVQPQRAPRAGSVLSQARFERPVVDDTSARALIGLAALHAEADRRVWFCGSYSGAGIPLLESAVRSAGAVARAIAAVGVGSVGAAPASWAAARSALLAAPSGSAFTRPL